MESRNWSQIEPINTPRLNASACKVGEKFIYLFGGLNPERNEFTDTIERYNTKLEIWATMSVKFPVKISNCFSFSFSRDFVLIMGGITKKPDPVIPTSSEINTNKGYMA
jgi:N-acetylneuraminic acid mutarotase